MRKILIIKTGYSEFLDRGLSTTVSLGDVLICTSLLHLYKNDHVLWVTSWEAKALLEGNPYIDELLIFGPKTFGRIAGSSYDILINLEKDIGMCSYLHQIRAKKRCGFYFNEKAHKISTFTPSTGYLLVGQEKQGNIKKNAFQILFETVGEKWRGQPAILSRKKHSPVKYDIGFNHAVGSKWPTKAWPRNNWKALEKILKKDFSVSWQEGFSDLETYINWIDSCRLIISSDSLGQIVVQALGKKGITLFGPTNYRRMDGNPEIPVVKSSLRCPYLPCYSPLCKYDKFCMDYIEPQKIAGICRRLLNPLRRCVSASGRVLGGTTK